MPIDVSVIVPVYNPGPYLPPLLESLDRQSIGWPRFEAIFVDDGSDDGTAATLDAWAASRDHAVVHHQANHGWPGQPRNVGLSMARGEYVQFVDQDDWLGDTALAALHAYARANTSDVVIGKMIGVSRGVPSGLFRRSVPRVELGREPVQDSQTPHKMFRRAFLDDIGLRFPEGTRRLEDHVFVTTAYLKAAVISINSDEDCYFHTARPDGGNAGFRAYDPVEYYRAVDEVLDIVDDLLAPGRVHDRFADRWLRIELVGRLHSPLVRNLDSRGRAAFLTEISRVIRTRYRLEAIRASTNFAMFGALVARHGTVDECARYAGAAHEMTLHAWRDGDRVRVRTFLRGREIPGGRMSSFLRRTVPRIADAVLADAARDPEIVAKVEADAGTPAGSDIAVRTVFGIRRTALSTHRRRSWRAFVPMRTARAVARRGKRLGRALKERFARTLRG